MCKVGILPGHLFGHIKVNHWNRKRTKGWRKNLQSKVSDILTRYRIHPTLRVKLPITPIPVIEILAAPVLGFSCDICPYWSLTAPSMLKHGNEKHRLFGVREEDLTRQYIQHLFERQPGSRTTLWFPVQEERPTTPAPDLLAEWSRGFDEARNAAMKTVQRDLAVQEISPFLADVKWHEALEGFDLQEVYNLAQNCGSEDDEVFQEAEMWDADSDEEFEFGARIRTGLPNVRDQKWIDRLIRHFEGYVNCVKDGALKCLSSLTLRKLRTPVNIDKYAYPRGAWTLD